MKFYKAFPILLATCLVVVAGANYFLVPSSPIDECERIFSSDVYAAYHEQIVGFLRQHPLVDNVKTGEKTPFNIKLNELIAHVDLPLGTSDETRKLHETFASELRELARMSMDEETQENEKESRRLFEDLIHWIYLGIDLNPAFQEFLFAFIPPPKGDLPDYLVVMQSELHQDKKFNGLRYEVEEEDGYSHGNLPSVYAELATPHKTKLIRAGRPFIQSFKLPWETPELSPEFVFFLKKSPGHCYVNLLKRYGSEWKTAKQIESLETKIPECYVITLDKNSGFYTQDLKTYPPRMEAEKFKSLFIQQLFLPTGNYYWSSHLDPEVWKKELEQIVERVQEDHFFEKTELNQTERRDFIELVYLETLDALVEKWDPPSMNFSCHQGMDRAPSLLVLWMQKRNQKSIQEAAALLLAPPLLVHNRASHLQRIKRFASALERLNKKEENVAFQSAGQAE